MKNTIKAFTLVEMLIVIVIIGILIASLMPRMQSAQWRARDVARKNDLSQIQTAIITSQQDKRTWPGMESTATTKANTAIPVSDITTLLQNAWMTQVPMDSNKSNTFKWLNGKDIANWNYGYMVTTRNSVTDGWFVLMAKTEVEWSSNWIVCDAHAAVSDKKTDLQTTGRFQAGVDLKDVVLCTEFVKDANWAAATACVMDTKGKCTYTDEAQLRYILVY